MGPHDYGTPHMSPWPIDVAIVSFPKKKSVIAPADPLTCAGCATAAPGKMAPRGRSDGSIDFQLAKAGCWCSMFQAPSCPIISRDIRCLVRSWWPSPVPCPACKAVETVAWDISTGWWLGHLKKKTLVGIIQGYKLRHSPWESNVASWKILYRWRFSSENHLWIGDCPLPCLVREGISNHQSVDHFCRGSGHLPTSIGGSAPNSEIAGAASKVGTVATGMDDLLLVSSGWSTTGENGPFMDGLPIENGDVP